MNNKTGKSNKFTDAVTNWSKEQRKPNWKFTQPEKCLSSFDKYFSNLIKKKTVGSVKFAKNIQQIINISPPMTVKQHQKHKNKQKLEKQQQKQQQQSYKKQNGRKNQKQQQQQQQQRHQLNQKFNKGNLTKRIAQDWKLDKKKSKPMVVIKRSSNIDRMAIVKLSHDEKIYNMSIFEKMLNQKSKKLSQAENLMKKSSTIVRSFSPIFSTPSSNSSISPSKIKNRRKTTVSTTNKQRQHLDVIEIRNEAEVDDVDTDAEVNLSYDDFNNFSNSKNSYCLQSFQEKMNEISPIKPFKIRVKRSNIESNFNSTFNELLDNSSADNTTSSDDIPLINLIKKSKSSSTKLQIKKINNKEKLKKSTKKTKKNKKVNPKNSKKKSKIENSNNLQEKNINEVDAVKIQENKLNEIINMDNLTSANNADNVDNNIISSNQENILPSINEEEPKNINANHNDKLENDNSNNSNNNALLKENNFEIETAPSAILTNENISKNNDTDDNKTTECRREAATSPIFKESNNFDPLLFEDIPESVAEESIDNCFNRRMSFGASTNADLVDAIAVADTVVDTVAVTDTETCIPFASIDNCNEQNRCFIKNQEKKSNVNDNEVTSTQEYPFELQTTRTISNVGVTNQTFPTISTSVSVSNLTSTSSSLLISSPSLNHQRDLVVQNDQVDTSNLPASISRRRIRKFSINEMSATGGVGSGAAGTGKVGRPSNISKRRKTFCFDTIDNRTSNFSTKSNNSTAPSLPLPSTTKPARRRGRPPKKSQNLSTSTSTSSTSTSTSLPTISTVYVKESSNPVRLSCYSPINEMPLNKRICRTYSKNSVAQRVFVPPEIEKCIESDNCSFGTASVTVSNNDDCPSTSQKTSITTKSISTTITSAEQTLNDHQQLTQGEIFSK